MKHIYTQLLLFCLSTFVIGQNSSVDYKLLQTLTGHTASVNSVDFSPDGNRIASGSGDNNIKIWNINNGNLLQILTGHTASVRSVNFSQDGTRIVSGSDDKSVKIWNANNGKLLQTLSGHTALVRSVNFSQDGSKIVSGSDDESVKIWNANNGQILHTLTGHTAEVNSVDFSPDGSKIISGSNDKRVKIWNVSNGTLLQTLSRHKMPVVFVCFSPDGNRIISCSSVIIKIWNASNGKLLQTLSGKLKVNFGNFSADGTRIVSGGWDRTIRIWDSNSGKLLQTLTGHTKPILSGNFSADGNRIVSCGFDGSIKIWGNTNSLPKTVEKTRPRFTWAFEQDSYANYELINTLSGHKGSVKSANFSPTGDKIVSCGHDKSIKIWNANNGQLLQTVIESQSNVSYSRNVSYSSFSPDGNRVVSSSYGFDDNIKIWNTSNGQLLQTLTGHKASVRSVSLSSNGSKIVSGSYDNSVKIWDANNGQLLHTLTGHTSSVNSVDFSPDGNKVISGSDDESVKIWNANNGQLLHTLTGHTSRVNSVDFSPDGNKVISGSYDNSVKIWNANNGQLLHTLSGHNLSVKTVNFSPAGNRIVSFTIDESIKLWNATNGKLVQTLTGHTAEVNSANFSPDGDRIVSCGKDNSIIIWDANNGKFLQMLPGHTAAVNSANFSPDGSKIVSASLDHNIKIWGNKSFLPKTDEKIKPGISWLKPDSSTTTRSPTFSIKVAISHPNKPITNVRLVHNGSVLTTRDFEIVKNTNTSTYSKRITKEIVLEEGANTVKATLEVDGTEYTSSSRTITKLTENPPSVVTNRDENKNEKRVALIIGNAAYKKGALKNPVNDANTMESTLQSLGFTVFKYTDCDQRQLKTAIRDFGSKLDEETIALAFYAGHGIEVNGRNYLVPTDATLDKEADVDLDCVSMGSILHQMEGANTKNNILILDACRNNPFARSWGRSTGSRGINFVSTPFDVFVLYATKPGNIASDGDAKNGLFKECFNKNLNIPNLSLAELIIRTSEDMESRSTGQQKPYTEGTLFNFIFNKQ